MAKTLWRTDSPPLAAPAFSLDPEIRALQEEAFQVVDALRGEFPGSSDPLVLLGNLHNTLGNSDAAAACWQRCLETDPKRADAYRGLGLVAMRKGQYEKALDLWRKALQIEPETSGARTLTARALIALGRPEEAVAPLKEDIDLSPDASRSHFELGQAYRQFKEYEKAKESYLAAVRARPDYTNAFYGLALACQRLGRTDEFGTYMEEFERLKAEDRQTDRDSRSAYDDVASARQSLAQTHTEAGQVYFGHGNVQSAQQHWQRAARLDPKNTVCRMQLVKVYIQDNRDREALKICEELSRINPEDAITYVNIGVLNARLNRLDAALSAVERAVALDPDNPACQRARKMIQERRRRGEFGG